MALLALGDAAAAVADLTAAIRLDPRYADAYHHRGNAHRLLGDEERAAVDFIEAIRLNPNAADVYESFSQLWCGASAPAGEHQMAVELARRACVLSGWEDWGSLRTLAAAHAAAGEFAAAVRWAGRALGSSPAAARPDCAADYDRYRAAARAR